VVCGSASFAFGSGISSAVVGYASLFTVQAVDSFGNHRTSSNNAATGHTAALGLRVFVVILLILF
jgi:hypothetical protein